ncbi:hypothetical protein AKJ16_DCAP08461 [Drosera capensis]
MQQLDEESLLPSTPLLSVPSGVEALVALAQACSDALLGLQERAGQAESSLGFLKGIVAVLWLLWWVLDPPSLKHYWSSKASPAEGARRFPCASCWAAFSSWKLLASICKALLLRGGQTPEEILKPLYGLKQSPVVQEEVSEGFGLFGCKRVDSSMILEIKLIYVRMVSSKLGMFDIYVPT